MNRPAVHPGTWIGQDDLMGIAIDDDRRDVAEVAVDYARSAGLLDKTRALAENSDLDLSASAAELANLGWTGVHLDEESGGAGASTLDLAVILEQLGTAAAPDLLLATTAVSSVIQRFGGADATAARAIDRLLRGEIGGVALNSDLERTAAGTATGRCIAVLCGAWAKLIAVAEGEDVLVFDTGAAGVHVERTTPFDPGSGLASLRLNAVEPLFVLRGARARLVAFVRAGAAAVAAGGARAVLDEAVSYAGVREQFGRPIGGFQAVKHLLADMLVDSERCVALAWDAARAQDEDDAQATHASAAAAALALPLFVRNAERCVQVHGAIGFTWEHDTHLYLRKAHALAAFAGADDAADELADLVASGLRRRHHVELPSEAEGFREAANAFATRARACSPEDRQRLAATTGYLVPHWPPPWGRGASPTEQLVIEQELADLDLPNLGIGGWVLRTIGQHATSEQAERWLPAGLAGDTVWCQLFSEPSAGSDAAAIRTRGRRVPGGWEVSGQKIWTSGAQVADLGLATIRTDPNQPKHLGMTTMVIGLHEPGVTVRPIREMTGDAFFNEVFFDRVFVPDDDVVGEVGSGWVVARSTLANERVSIGGDVPSRMVAAELASAVADSGHRREVGLLLAEHDALEAMNVRQVELALHSEDPGVNGSLIKLAKAEHTQRVTGLAMRLGGAGLLTRPDHISWTYLMCRALTIAGGTSEISRNLIAERGLGLPRDPSPPSRDHLKGTT